jgi:hypothetical protein
MIAGSLSNCIAGFHRSWRSSPSSGPRRSCVGTGPAFALALEVAIFGGRPQIDAELRVLIQRMSMDNPLWGAPCIHGELLKLGFEIAQSSVAKYMVKRREPQVEADRRDDEEVYGGNLRRVVVQEVQPSLDVQPMPRSDSL